MHTSLFNRLYSYRQREGKNARENFLIELLGYALEKHETFREGFLALIDARGQYNSEDFIVSTQSVYNQGRPDLEIQASEQYVILIECKVESKEGFEQLPRYREILKSKVEETKDLVYLTKYIEPKDDDIINLRWYQVVDLLQSLERSEVLNELLKYLIEEGMDTKDFNLQDLGALVTMQDTMRKMDEVLNRVVNNFAEEFGAPLKDKSSRPLAINQKGWYGDIKYLNKSYFVLAFRKQSPDGWPEIFAEFGIKKTNELEKASVVSWCNDLSFLMNEDTNFYYCGRYQNIMTMTAPGQDMTDACVLFFEAFLNDLQRAKQSWKVLCEV